MNLFHIEGQLWLLLLLLMVCFESFTKTKMNDQITIFFALNGSVLCAKIINSLKEVWSWKWSQVWRNFHLLCTEFKLSYSFGTVISNRITSNRIESRDSRWPLANRYKQVSVWNGDDTKISFFPSSNDWWRWEIFLFVCIEFYFFFWASFKTS